MSENPEESRRQLPGETESSGDVQALLKSVKENPLLYAGGVAFLVAVVVAASLYRMSQNIDDRESASIYARALDVEDAAERAVALSELAEGNTTFAARALYLRGESYFAAGSFAEAQADFSRLRDEHSDFEFVPDAVEGLGNIEENEGRYDAALAYYREVGEKWPGTAAGMRQPMNMGRCLQDSGQFAEAVEQYRAQLELFPGTMAAMEAQQKLADLRTSHPELFEVEVSEPAFDASSLLDADGAIELSEPDSGTPE